GGGGGAGLGGAIFIRNGALTLINTTFTNNAATGGLAGAAGNGATAGQGKGGALFALNDGVNGTATARSLFAAPSFRGNTAADAGTVITNPQDNNDVFGTLTVDDRATLTASGGTPQATAVNTPFAQPLRATLRDGGGNPVAGAAITF